VIRKGVEGILMTGGVRRKDFISDKIEYGILSLADCADYADLCAELSFG